MQRMTVKEVAEFLKVHVNTVRLYLEKGILTKHQLFKNATVWVDKEEVENLFKVK